MSFSNFGYRVAASMRAFDMYNTRCWVLRSSQMRAELTTKLDTTKYTNKSSLGTGFKSSGREVN
ncbi:unnamed protein product [Prunus armeniaca]